MNNNNNNNKNKNKNKIKFDDVINCKDFADFGQFVRDYYEDHKIFDKAEKLALCGLCSIAGKNLKE